MKPILATFAALIFHQFSYATTIEWGILESSAPDPYHYGDVLVHSTTLQHLDVSFYIGVGSILAPDYNTDRKGSVAQIETYVSGAWISAKEGETVNADSMLGKSNYFFNETFGSAHPDFWRPECIEQEAGVHKYLKFLIQDYDEVVDYVNGKIPDATTYYYGWAEYMVDVDGTFRLLNSAIDFDGGAMVVGGGAVPEPTGGLLLLVGVAALALRRGRAFGRLRGRS